LLKPEHPFTPASGIPLELIGREALLEGNGPPHAFIVVDAYNLLRIFPPSRKYPMNVMKVGDSYLLEESTDQ
jgi:hypothetical protein